MPAKTLTIKSMHPYEPRDPWAPKSAAEKRLQRQAYAFSLKMYVLYVLIGITVGWILFH